MASQDPDQLLARQKGFPVRKVPTGAKWFTLLHRFVR
jgi:hypothetical protein